MSFFWSKPAPPHAVFACYPFGKLEKIIFPNKILNLPPPKEIKIRSRSFLPSQQLWIENVYNTLNNNTLKKAVLARECTIECENAPDPFAVTSFLLAKAKNSIVFCFANEQMAFLGATPELLFSRSGRDIQCEAVAGTSPLGRLLLNDAKARSEILPVIEYLQHHLSPFCVSSLQISPIHIRKTSNVQHLCATLHGTLKTAITDEQIIQQLHPTPALCGVPKREAMHWIQQCEPFERGLYGGVMGWSTPEESVFAVGIRSCLIQGSTVKLYSGAGIVAGSDPLDEWEELNHKMNLYQGIFV
ncbi:MAG TPA: isochorismate synthase [Chlamydiales bacterium]|nr:isochorismate synthase [Chlamydiales bacterium]